MNLHFSELLIVIIVALLVIKPEKLPETARQLARFIKQIKLTVAKLKNELEQHE